MLGEDGLFKVRGQLEKVSEVRLVGSAKLSLWFGVGLGVNGNEAVHVK